MSMVIVMNVSNDDAKADVLYAIDGVNVLAIVPKKMTKKMLMR